jgi:hypothetical protein
MILQGLPDAPFWTNTFYKENELSGRQLVRVFWSWYNPESTENGNKIIWEAPGNARWHFGNTRALYKMYFTSEMRDPMETAEQSSCLRFARDFMPEIDKALATVQNKLDPGVVGDSADKPIDTTPAGPEAQAPVDQTIGNAKERTEPDAAINTPNAESGHPRESLRSETEKASSATPADTK